MLLRIAILIGLASAVLCSAVEGDEAQGSREGRFWWPAWWGEACTTKSDYSGSCFKDFECLKRGGTADGTCGGESDDEGICCDLLPGGDTTISSSGEYFTNKGNPDTDDKGAVATLNPPAGTVQIRLDFEDFMLIPPVEGECSNDTFMFSGANPGAEIPILCGYNSGQHMYIDVDNSDGPWKLEVKTSDADYARSWKIKVQFLAMSSMERAPFRCLQFYPEEKGDMMSFNYNSEGDSMMLNNQLYSICFGYKRGMCDIAITLPRFDLGPMEVAPNCGDRFLRASSTTVCGDYEDYSLNVNGTGPVTMMVSADDDNEEEEEGFMASYMMLPCE